MHPTAELTRLARHKLELCQRIAETRGTCLSLAADVAQPLETIDRMRERWRRMSPYAQWAVIPLALLLRRGWNGRRTGGVIRTVWRWLPVAIGAGRLWRGWARRA